LFLPLTHLEKSSKIITTTATSRNVRLTVLNS
jgi:hypothetical protein